MRVGVDASNLRQGGGFNHLVSLLGAGDPPAAGITRVVVWGASDLLDALPDRPWLVRRQPSGLSSSVGRALWQHSRLGAAAAAEVDLLFLPGGTYLGRFRPFVTMFRNMLPFDPLEIARQRSARFRSKMRLLRAAQGQTLRRADGLIFLSEYARDCIAAAGVGTLGRTAVIPHGIDGGFFAAPRGHAAAHFTPARPFKWLYASAIFDYKRPWNVAEAAARLRRQGAPVALEFLGSGLASSTRHLRDTVRRLDPSGTFITMSAAVPHADVASRYAASDGFVFASVCENMPISLLEAMASGLPIVCSDRSAMPGVLQDGGLYCDPESAVSIADAMDRLLRDAVLRAQLAARAHTLAQQYSWARCASDTFEFLASTTCR